jgi:preprotein translocase subunit SecD
LFRPVLCAVPPYDKFVTSRQPALSAASCGPSGLTPASMQVTPSRHSVAGFTYRSPQPAIILEGERTTTPSHDTASKVVLLGGLPGSSVYAATPTSKGVRYVLGPAVMTSRSIASATAVKTPAGLWVVDWTTTPSGSALWNRVARASFHQLLALDVGGVVVSAPIIEPTQSSFTSFKGRGQVSGNWNQAEATRIASAMQSGG